METWKLLHCIDGWQWGLSRYPSQSPSLSSFAAISCLVCGWLSLPFFLSQFYLATWLYQVTLPRNLAIWLNQVSQVPSSRTRYIRYHRFTINFRWVDSYWFDHLLRVFVEKTTVAFLSLWNHNHVSNDRYSKFVLFCALFKISLRLFLCSHPIFSCNHQNEFTIFFVIIFIPLKTLLCDLGKW